MVLAVRWFLGWNIENRRQEIDQIPLKKKVVWNEKGEFCIGAGQFPFDGIRQIYLNLSLLDCKPAKGKTTYLGIGGTLSQRCTSRKIVFTLVKRMDLLDRVEGQM